MAVREIVQARAEGRIPLLVGGTGLYFRALFEGLAPVPDVPPGVREEARERHKRLGGEKFHAELQAIDPEMASRLQPGDSQRLIRAWEVIRATGRSLAEWQALPPEGPALPGTVVRIVLDPLRDWLYQRCDDRLHVMAAQGALDEARALAALGLDPGLPAMKALGVPEFLSVVRGQCSLEEAITLAQTATRRYAKRQLTWFRHQMPNAIIIQETDLETRLARVMLALGVGADPRGH
jgi:tRNA dimethylallyltransferase